MKFYINCPEVSILEDYESELLIPVTISLHQRTIRKYEWGKGWLFEADESIRSFCLLSYNFLPLEITEQEYYEIFNFGVTYLGKERSIELLRKIPLTIPPRIPIR